MVPKSIALALVMPPLCFLSACMQAEKISLDTSSPAGVLLGAIGLGVGAAGAGANCTPTTIDGITFASVPREMQIAPDGSLYVIQQNGTVQNIDLAALAVFDVYSSVGARGLAVTSGDTFSASNSVYRNGIAASPTIPAYSSAQSLSFDEASKTLFVVATSREIQAYNVTVTNMVTGTRSAYAAGQLYGIRYHGNFVYATAQPLPSVSTSSSILRWNTSDGISPEVLAGQDNALTSLDELDGVGAAARFSYPEGIAVDSAGSLYVTDFGGADATHYGTIRKITPPDWNVRTIYRFENGFAGTGIVIDLSGTLYVGRADNNTADGTSHGLMRIPCASSL